MRVMECINIRPDQIGTEKKGNCKFTNVQVLNLLMLFPFFVVRNAYYNLDSQTLYNTPMPYVHLYLWQYQIYNTWRHS